MNCFYSKGAHGSFCGHRSGNSSRRSYKNTRCIASTWRCEQHVSKPILRPAASASHQQTAQQQQTQPQLQRTYDPEQWREHATSVLHSFGLPSDSRPQQLWQHLSPLNCTQDQQHQIQKQLQQNLNISSWRVLHQAAISTCNSQQQYNQLQPLIDAAPVVFPAFMLEDFRQLLQLCARNRYIPDKEWLAAVIYADTGGFERLYQQSPAADIIHLLADLSAVFSSHRQLYIDTQQQLLLLQQQQQQQQQQQLLDQVAVQPSASPSSSSSTTTAVSPSDLAAEVSALQAALQTSTANLMAIQQDALLAGELSAVGGYWLVRRLLPQLADGGETAAALRGFGALQGLNYQALDTEEADVLISLLTAHLPTWSPDQLAAALSSSLPCLGQHAPSDGQGLALLFAAAGAAAGAGLGAKEAGQLLVVLAQLPGYAPDAKVAQALLDCALQPPLKMTAKQSYQLLSAASELEAAPRAQHLQLIQDVLKG